MRNALILLTIITILVIGVWYFYVSNREPIQNILSFEDCVKASYPVMESYPRQCKTPDGRIFTEELKAPPVTYKNASDDIIKVELPFPGAIVDKEFDIIGQARGNWFFEADFPVELLDKDGNRIATAIATAQEEWMTLEFVPFKASVKAPGDYIGEAILVLHKHNASGLPEHEASISFPIIVEY